MMGKPALGAFLLLLASAASAATIHVPDDFPTIQDALDAAMNNDVIIVRAGTYVENIDFLGKAVVLRSEAGPDATAIDANSAGSVVTFQSAEGADSVIEGFTLFNGTGTVHRNWLCGGGIYCVDGSSPTIRNNVIEKNIAEHKGGGIYCDSSSPLISGNRIGQNTITEARTLDHGGGGIFCNNSSAVIWQNTLTRNGVEGKTSHQGWGGGLFCRSSSLTVADNVIEKNSSCHAGGGIYVYNNTSSEPSRIIKNVISENSAFTGGGIVCGFASPLLVSNSIGRNSANWSGGVGLSYSDAAIYNCRIFENTASSNAGGLDCYESSPLICNCTFARNVAFDSGGAIYCCYKTAPEVVNSILWGNLAFKGSEIYLDDVPDTTLSISHSNVAGGQGGVYVGTGATLGWGQGMIDADPVFAAIHEQDLHLLHASPCRDAGDSGAVPAELAKDFEGGERIVDGAVDMGADEFHACLYLGGPVLASSGELELRLIGKPNATFTLALGSGVLDPPVPTPYGDFFLMAPLFPMVTCQLWADGFITFESNIPSAWQPGDRRPFQARVGDWGGSDTQFTNLLLVVVE